VERAFTARSILSTRSNLGEGFLDVSEVRSVFRVLHPTLPHDIVERHWTMPTRWSFQTIALLNPDKGFMIGHRWNRTGEGQILS